MIRISVFISLKKLSGPQTSHHSIRIARIPEHSPVLQHPVAVLHSLLKLAIVHVTLSLLRS